jgi:hypothetical protein
MIGNLCEMGQRNLHLLIGPSDTIAKFVVQILFLTLFGQCWFVTFIQDPDWCFRYTSTWYALFSNRYQKYWFYKFYSVR